MNLKILKPPSVVKRICERYKAGYSPIIIFCGKMRVGKTTKAFLIMNWICWILFKRKWNWRKGTMITFDQILNELDDPTEPAKLADEIQRMFSKKDVMKQESILGNKLLTSQAYFHYIFGMILPKASALGSDHIANVDYVIYVKNRKQLLPYKIDNNLWDIDLKNRKVKKFFLTHFDLDIKNPKVKKAFEEELKELPEFKAFIEKNLKEKIINDMKEKRGLTTQEVPATITIRRD